jgi:hypothetical protein
MIYSGMDSRHVRAHVLLVSAIVGLRARLQKVAIIFKNVLLSSQVFATRRRWWRLQAFEQRMHEPTPARYPALMCNSALEAIIAVNTAMLPNVTYQEGSPPSSQVSGTLSTKHAPRRITTHAFQCFNAADA